MAESILKIHTQNGDIPVGYPGLANKPIADKTLSVEGAFADSKAVGDKFKQVKAETDSLKEDISTKIAKFYASSQGETHLADSDNGKIMDMMVYGKSEQKQYSGKNLFTFSNNSRDINGVIFEAKDGIITAKGTSTKEYTRTYFQFNYPKDTFTIGETYTFSLNSNDANLCLIALYKKNDMVDYKMLFEKTTKCATVKIPDNVDLIIRCVVDINVTVNATATIQIEKGSEATSYEPYTGGIPSPNPDYPQEIKSVVNPTVKVCGKNLLELPISNKSIQAGITFEVINDSVIKITGINDGSRVSQYIAYNSQDVKHAKLIPYKNIAITISTYNDDVIAGLAYWLKSDNYATVHYKQNKRKCTIDLGEDAKIVPWFFIPQNGTYTNNTVKFGVYYGTDELTYDAPKCHTVTLPYTLNAIPVNSGGNVTINGQQYIADYVDVERGKLVRMVSPVVVSDSEYITGNNNSHQVRINKYIKNTTGDKIGIILCDKLRPASAGDVWNGVADNIVSVHNGDPRRLTFRCTTKANDMDSALKFIKSCKIYIALAEPEEIDLATEEIAAFKSLATYYPTTNIFINSEQLDGYTVFNYPISMANGWNYVKKQLNDNRDYIYDMDIQSAEAYVNSEYAVALTELEV